jgi:hypothetical protein
VCRAAVAEMSGVGGVTAVAVTVSVVWSRSTYEGVNVEVVVDSLWPCAMVTVEGLTDP